MTLTEEVKEKKIYRRERLSNSLFREPHPLAIMRVAQEGFYPFILPTMKIFQFGQKIQRI
jgi:hypothetical protein